jgi:hypothetical protein
MKVKIIAVATASALAVAGVAGTAAAAGVAGTPAAHIGYIPPVYYESSPAIVTDSTAPVDSLNN